MANEYHKTGNEVGQIGSFGFSKDVEIQRKDTGERALTTVWRGTEQSENRQIGENVAKGKTHSGAQIL
jgi:hypothetical protein